MQRIAMVLALLVVGATATAAQQQHANELNLMPGMVHGSKNPERIPDEVAFRLYFTARAIGPDAPERLKQFNNRKLQEIGLDAADFKVLTSALNDFHTNYTALLEAHNRQAEVAESLGKHGDVERLHTSVAWLVADTRRTLAVGMSVRGQELLRKTIEFEKSGMAISESEATK